MQLKIGDLVKFTGASGGKPAYGLVVCEPQITPSGEVVKIATKDKVLSTYTWHLEAVDQAALEINKMLK